MAPGYDETFWEAKARHNDRPRKALPTSYGPPAARHPVGTQEWLSQVACCKAVQDSSLRVAILIAEHADLGRLTPKGGPERLVARFQRAEISTLTELSPLIVIDAIRDLMAAGLMDHRRLAGRQEAGEVVVELLLS